MNSKNSIREWINTGLIAICAISLVIVVILFFNLSQVLQSTPTDLNSTTSNSLPSSVEEMKSIETAYGKIQFPFELEEYLVYEEIKSDKGTEYVFYCLLADEKIEMYRVIFGDSKAENIAGYLERDGERIPVSIESSAIEIDGYSEDDVEILQSMSSTYNDVILSIAKWDGFVYE